MDSKNIPTITEAQKFTVLVRSDRINETIEYFEKLGYYGSTVQLSYNHAEIEFRSVKVKVFNVVL